MEARLARLSPLRWLERIGNGAPRQIVALKDKTRLTGLLAYPVYSICNPPCVPGI